MFQMHAVFASTTAFIPHAKWRLSLSTSYVAIYAGFQWYTWLKGILSLDASALGNAFCNILLAYELTITLIHVLRPASPQCATLHYPKLFE